MPPSFNGLLGLRVCLLTGTLQRGGAERQLYYIARALKDAGAQIQVLSLTRGDFWEAPLVQAGIPVIWVGRSRSRLARLLHILREARRFRAKLIHCQHFYTNFYGAIAARILGLREIGGIRSNVFSELAGAGRCGGALSLRLPRMFAANSQAAITTLSNLGISPRRTFYLPNVIDTELFRPRTRETRDESEPVRLLAVGRLSHEKRFDRFIELVAMLRLESPRPVKGIIVGSDQENPGLKLQLQQQAAGLGLAPEHLEFRGAASKMESVYPDADVLVLTSDYEGTPNVVMEAMACGLSVVATAVGGVPDLVQHGTTGYLVGTELRDQMVDWVLKLVGDREQRVLLGGQARAYVESAHSLHRLPARLVRLYDQAGCQWQSVDGRTEEFPSVGPALGSGVKR